MKRRALCIFFTHLDFTRSVVVRKRIALAAYVHPQDILGFAGVGHDFDWPVIVLAPENCAPRSQRDFFDVPSMVIGPLW